MAGAVPRYLVLSKGSGVRPGVPGSPPLCRCDLLGREEVWGRGVGHVEIEDAGESVVERVWVQEEDGCCVHMVVVARGGVGAGGGGASAWLSSPPQSASSSRSQEREAARQQSRQERPAESEEVKEANQMVK